MKKEELLKLFPVEIRNILQPLDIDFEKITEIRIRAERPVLIYQGNTEILVSQEGHPYLPDRKTIQNIMEYISEFSVYAFEEELRQGFLTLKGGHRVGISGKPVLTEGKIKSFQYITGFNFRLAHEKYGAAESVMQHLYRAGGVRNTLIISPPGFGKTTMLRDIIRILSDGSKGHPGMTVGVVDERSEIGGSYLGVPQNQLGIRTDLLDACPKSEGMMMLIRSMSPRVIAVDELGGQADVEAVRKCIRCGCRLIATVHGADLEELSKRPDFCELLDEEVFERFLILKKTGIGEYCYILYNQKLETISAKQLW